ncbi:MAG: alpha/beta hydrolase fold domain-containing protein, partial [Polyangiaceae bacterium]
RRGYAVFNINYRLAPRDPFPAAVQDVAAAYRWVVDNAAAWGADAGRLVLAGESAGANLAATLAVMTCYPRPEPWAREVFDVARPARAVIAACGMMQVSDPARFRRRKPNLGTMLFDRISEVSSAYLDGPASGDCDLADPLCIVERGAPERALPPFFLPVGTRDPILDDTRRFGAALERLGVPADVRYYRGGVHAFHAAVFTEAARQCWHDTFAFLDRWVPAPSRDETATPGDFVS